MTAFLFPSNMLCPFCGVVSGGWLIALTARYQRQHTGYREDRASRSRFSAVERDLQRSWFTWFSFERGFPLRHLHGNPARGRRLVRNGNLPWTAGPQDLRWRVPDPPLE